MKTCVAVFAEAEGSAHLHAHVVPRHTDLPADRRGPAVFAYLGVSPAEQFAGPDLEDLARRLSDAIDREHRPPAGQ